MSHLTIIRGLPGVGKTQYAKTHFDAFIIEADMYFLRDGKYTFDHEKIRESHSLIRGLFSRIASTGADVVVTGYYTRNWELAGILRIGKASNYQITIIDMPDDQLGNPHDLPNYVIDAMKERKEEISDELKTEYRISLQSM